MSSKKDTKKDPKKEENTPPRTPTRPTSPPDFEQKRAEELRKEEEERRRKEEERKKREIEEEEERKQREEEQRKKEEEEQKRLQELARKKVKEELTARRRKQWQIQDDREELNTITPQSEARYPPHNEKLSDSFSKLTAYTRDLSTERSWHVPEIVFIGYEGEGKSTLLEAVLGHATFAGHTLERPIYLNLLNNLSCEEPRITIKRDTFFAEFASDEQVTQQNLPAEIQRRNMACDHPIRVRYEWRYTLNLTLIETPGLKRVARGKVSQDRETIVMDEAKPPERTLVFVEEAKEAWDVEQAHIADFAEKVDPKLSRSVFVYSKFHFQLADFSSAKELTAYLSGRPAAKARAFFVTLISPQARLEATTSAKFKERVEQTMQRDLNLMEKLHYDHKHDSLIGMQALRKHLMESTWKRYQDSIPDLLKQIRTLKKERGDALEAIQQQLRTLDKNKLRSIASGYVSDFLQYVVALLQGSEGSIEGNIIGSNGQTLDEEKTVAGLWTFSDGKLIPFDHKLEASGSAPSTPVPNWNAKLFGGQQFERLLAEFKAVSDSLAVTDLTADEIATSSGLSGFKHSSNHTWAASDLVQRRLDTIFTPLLSQLISRAIYIAKRLPLIVENIMETKRSSKYARAGTGQSRDNDAQVSMKDFPRFTWYVKDLFEDVVEDTARSCLDKCLDELQCTKVITWENAGKKLDEALKTKRGNSKDKVKDGQSLKAVRELVAQTFTEQQHRITKNVILKCYENFLVKMQKTVTGAIQGQIACLSEEMMGEMFDLEATINKLKAEEARLKEVVTKDAETGFMESAAKFRL